MSWQLPDYRRAHKNEKRSSKNCNSFFMLWWSRRVSDLGSFSGAISFRKCAGNWYKLMHLFAGKLMTKCWRRKVYCFISSCGRLDRGLQPFLKRPMSSSHQSLWGKLWSLLWRTRFYSELRLILNFLFKFYSTGRALLGSVKRTLR